MEQLRSVVDRFRTRDPKLAVTFNPEGSGIATLRGKLADPVEMTELKRAPFDHARRFVRENSALLGGVDEAGQLAEERVLTDRTGTTHVILKQRHGQAEVLGATVSVHYGPDGALTMVKSTLAPHIDLPTQPRFDSKLATQIALQHAGRGAVAFEGLSPALIVADTQALHLGEAYNRYYLCWRLAVTLPPGSVEPGWIYLVDAISGAVLLRYPAARTGTGTGYYSHGAGVNSEVAGGTHRLRDAVTSSTWPVAAKPAVRTYDDQGGASFTGTTYSEDTGDTWDNAGAVPAHRHDDQRTEVDIHRFAAYAVSYFFDTHGYNGWNGAGSDIRAHAHNEYMSNNAFWYGLYEQMYFADGNNTTRDFMGTLDVVAHEYAHGVKYYFNVLQTYLGETGALDEATSDMFGCLLALDYPADDPWPWVQGRQYRLDGTIGRNMVDPSRDSAGVVHYDATSEATKRTSCLNGYYPDHYSIRYSPPLPWDYTNDNGGVHFNCPIITHALYLMMNGGTHRLSNVTVTGIGVGPVEQMVYHVISTGLLSNTSDFADFRLAFIDSCQALYPDNLDYLATVKAAFFAVGIGADLYVRDTLTDQGDEPAAYVSSTSPDIILRQQQADAATLTALADVNNVSLHQDIALGPVPQDHYLYFRLFNRGSAAASGTFRLFVSPVSTFPVPTSWSEVGHYDFPSIAAGGLWVPTAATDCITLQAALINTLGTGHFCFIGVVESDDDPPPDYGLIGSVSEFHSYIQKSNNYGWRNCDIVPLSPESAGDVEATARAFRMNGFDRRNEVRDLEIDTRDLPAGTAVLVRMPAGRMAGVKAAELRLIRPQVRWKKIAGVIEDIPEKTYSLYSVAMSRLMQLGDFPAPTPIETPGEEANWKAVRLPAGKVHRLTGIRIAPAEHFDVRFAVKFPARVSPRDVSLVFRERGKAGKLGQMNYIYRFRR